MFLLFDVPVGMGHYSLIGGGFKHCVFLTFLQIVFQTQRGG